MDLRKVKKLIELVEESAIEELEVANGEESIRIVMRRPGGPPAVVTAAATVAQAAVVEPAPAGAVSVPAPMAGTFYRAPHPDAGPFVEPGQAIHTGDVLCIIESMKMMHEIHAAQDGVIVQICVENGQPINTGDTLFKLS